MARKFISVTGRFSLCYRVAPFGSRHDKRLLSLDDKVLDAKEPTDASLLNSFSNRKPIFFSFDNYRRYKRRARERETSRFEFEIFSYFLQNGYPARRRSLVDDARFETLVVKQTKQSVLEEARQRANGK